MNRLKSARASGTLGVAALAFIASPFAVAADSGWYVGGNVGLSEATIDDKRITRSLLDQGFATASMDDDESDIGYKLFGGYQFNRYVALEGGYFDLGKFSFTATTTGPDGTLNGDIALNGVNADVVGFLPLGEKLAVTGRVGANYARAKASFSGTGAVTVLDPSPSNRDTGYKFGLGLQYDVTESLGLRAEAERYRIDDTVGNKGDVDLYSAGLVYRFGRNTPAPVAYVAAAAPVVVTPQPQPVAVPPPPPPPRALKVNFSADSLFDFDKAVLRPAGKQDLDKFAADLRGANFDVITITGHTDRIGSHEYNTDLSTRRAEAVKTYLVESAGLPAGKISATGVDGSNPVTTAGECQGTKATKQLIACLQPDRRVEVEVSGTR